MNRKKTNSIFIEHVYPILGLILGALALLITFFQWNEIKGILPWLKYQSEITKIQDVELGVNIVKVLDYVGWIYSESKIADKKEYLIIKKEYNLQLIWDKMDNVVSICFTQKDPNFRLSFYNPDYKKDGGNFVLGEAKFGDFDFEYQVPYPFAWITSKTIFYWLQWWGYWYQMYSNFSISNNSFWFFKCESCWMPDIQAHGEQTFPISLIANNYFNTYCIMDDGITFGEEILPWWHQALSSHLSP